MKTSFVLFMTALTWVACSESQKNESRNVTLRSPSTVVYFYDGLPDDISYDSLNNEHDAYIEDDFMFRPYGSANWTTYSGYSQGIRVKIKCSCDNWESPAGSCSPSVSGTGPVTVDCLDPCEQGCKMKVRIRNIANGETISEFDSGGEFRK